MRWGFTKGSAITDHQYIYCTSGGSNTLFRYEWNTDEWLVLPPLPYIDSGLVIINGELTTVGGREGPQRTKDLLTLRQGKWVPEYPPMHTARSHTAVVSTPDGNFVFVIGGCFDNWTPLISVGGVDISTTVLLFQVKTRKWYELTSLPSLPSLSTTICRNQLYVIGDDLNGYSCSLQALLSIDQATTSQCLSRFITWTPVPPLPLYESTAATPRGQLIIIGGEERLLQGEKIVRIIQNTVYQLLNGQWVHIGRMYQHRKQCLAVSPSHDKVFVIGGWTEYGKSLFVEEYIVV